MSLLENYRAFARYNQWMNEKLYKAAAELTDAQRKEDRGAFFGSIHRTLNHILFADRTWIGRLAPDKSAAEFRDEKGDLISLKGYGPDLYERFEILRREREKTDHYIVQWMENLSGQTADGMASYSNLSGKKFGHPYWWALSHFFNHQTHHRGQVTTLLSQFGKDVGDTDLIAWLRTS